MPLPPAAGRGHARPAVSARGQAGVTLVELLIASTIAAMLAVAMANIFSSVLEVARTAQAGRTVERQAQMAIGRLREDVSSARRVVAITATSLDLQATGGSLVSYALVGADSLQRSVDGGPWRLVTTGVDSLALGLQTVARSFTREEMLPDTVEALMRSFQPGDLDAWVASTHCDYEPNGKQSMHDNDWAAVQFWSQPAGFFAFSRVEVRLAALEHNPPEMDVRARIYQSNVSGWPGILVAEGTASRLLVPASFGWVSISLTPIVYGTISPTGDYWLILASTGVGHSSYAGHFEYGGVDNCWVGEWPVNDACYRETADGGGHWTSSDYEYDGFHRIYGLTSSLRLAEVTETLTDTLGVTYALVLRQGEEAEQRAGFIALYSP